MRAVKFMQSKHKYMYSTEVYDESKCIFACEMFGRWSANQLSLGPTQTPLSSGASRL